MDNDNLPRGAGDPDFYGYPGEKKTQLTDRQKQELQEAIAAIEQFDSSKSTIVIVAEGITT